MANQDIQKLAKGYYAGQDVPEETKEAWEKGFVYAIEHMEEIMNPEGYKYVIIDLNDMDYMKNEKGEINYYDTLDEAASTCGMYEFEDAWVMKLIYNHKEREI